MRPSRLCVKPNAFGRGVETAVGSFENEDRNENENEDENEDEDESDDLLSYMQMERPHVAFAKHEIALEVGRRRGGGQVLGQGRAAVGGQVG